MSFVVEFIARLKDEVSGGLGKMTGSLSRFESQLQKSFVDGARTILPAQFGFVADELERLSPAALAAGGAFLGIGGAIAAVGSKAVELAMQVKDTAIQFDILASKTGASVEFLSGFSAAAKDAEVSQETLNVGLTRFSDYLASTVGPTANLEVELLKIADTFSAMPDGPAKTALAMNAFGKSGSDLIPILSQGSVGVRQLMLDMSEAGRVIDADTVAAAKRLDDQLDSLNGKMEGFGNRVGSAVIPALSSLIDQLNLTIDAVGNSGNSLEDLNTAMSLLNPATAALATNSAIAANQLEALGTAAENAAVRAGNAALNAVRAAASLGTVVISAQQFGAQMAAKAENIARAAGQRQMGLLQQQGDLQARVRSSMDARDDKSVAANRELTKSLEYGAEAMRVQQREADKTTGFLDEYNLSLLDTVKAGGGAARATSELVSEQEALQRSIQNIRGMLSGSLTEMDDLQRVQTAYAIATGELSEEQFDQQQAVKGLMQAVKDKRVSEEQAVTTALALANGIATTGDAYAIAGESGAKFAAESANVQGSADRASKKVAEMASAIKALPKNTAINVSAAILGMTQLTAAKAIVEYLDAHDRHTITYDVIYRTTGTPPPTGADVPANVAGGQNVGTPTAGTPSTANGTRPPAITTPTPSTGVSVRSSGRGQNGSVSIPAMLIVSMDDWAQSLGNSKGAARVVARVVASNMS